MIAFGSIFQGIEVVKMNYDTSEEFQRITVPLTYEGKETYVTRLLSDPDLTRGVQLEIPALSYHFTGLRYRSDRQQQSLIRGQLTQSGNSATKVYVAVPYDLNFEVYLYARNMEDGFQVIEQILPVFNPDYSLSLKYLSSANNYISQDFPVVLENTIFENDYEGAAGKVRMITWTLQFSIKTFFYGPQPPTGLIKDVIVNFRNSESANGNALYAIANTTVDPPTANVTDSWTANTVITEPNEQP